MQLSFLLCACLHAPLKLDYFEVVTILGDLLIASEATLPLAFMIVLIICLVIERCICLVIRGILSSLPINVLLKGVKVLDQCLLGPDNSLSSLLGLLYLKSACFNSLSHLLELIDLPA